MPPKRSQPAKQQPKKSPGKPDKSKDNKKQQPSKPGKNVPEKDAKGKPTDKKGAGGKGAPENPKDAGKGKNEVNKSGVKDPKKDLQSSKSVQKLDPKGKKGEDKNAKGKDDKNAKGKDDKNAKDVKGGKDAKGKSIEKDAKGKEVRDAKSKDQKNRNQDKNQKGGKDKKPDPKIESPKGKQSPRGNLKVSTKQEPPKPKKEQDIIKQSGLLEAYELFLRAVCKHGLPEGNVYEFAAQQIQRYERKKRAQQLKAKAEQQIERAARRHEQRLQSIQND